MDKVYQGPFSSTNVKSSIAIKKLERKVKIPFLFKSGNIFLSKINGEVDAIKNLVSFYKNKSLILSGLKYIVKSKKKN